jgi:Fe2+ transport system protein FeoA
VIKLSDAKPGQVCVVKETSLSPKDAALLRAMGLRPAAHVRVCRLGEPCIVEVLTNGACGPDGCGCRIGLSLPLARQVFITEEGAPIASNSATTPTHPTTPGTANSMSAGTPASTPTAATFETPRGQ